MAGFFATCAKLSKMLFHFGVIWIVSCIDLMILNHIADCIQRFLNVFGALVSGVG